MNRNRVSLQSILIALIASAFPAGLKAQNLDVNGHVAVESAAYVSGADTKTDAAVILKNSSTPDSTIYFESGGNYLRRLIGVDDTVISIGQLGTALVSSIVLQPGNQPNGKIELYSANQKTMVVKDDRVGIGTTTPGNKLEVNGTIRSKEVIVESTGWPDYVFEDGYVLPSLSDVESHIEENGHLPGIEPASAVNEGGQSLGAMQRQMMQKIEELTLYVIELKKDNEKLHGQVNELKARINQ